jgi:hypothetical protein
MNVLSLIQALLYFSVVSVACVQADQLHHDARPQQRKEADGCE